MIRCSSWPVATPTLLWCSAALVVASSADVMLCCSCGCPQRCCNTLLIMWPTLSLPSCSAVSTSTPKVLLGCFVIPFAGPRLLPCFVTPWRNPLLFWCSVALATAVLWYSANPVSAPVWLWCSPAPVAAPSAVIMLSAAPVAADSAVVICFCSCGSPQRCCDDILLLRPL